MTARPTTPPALTHRQISMFRAVMLHGQLSRAADVLGTSQPTLSRELARLEQVLTFMLFDRVRGRLRPTARALMLFQAVERSFVGLDEIAHQALALRHFAASRLRLACLPALAHALVPAALQGLQKSHPSAAVSIHPEESPWLEQALAEQRFDLGLSEALEAPFGCSLEFLYQAAEVAVLPTGHALLRKKILSPADFTDQSFISLAPGDPYRAQIDAMFAQYGVSRQMVYETASAVAVCAMVQHGLGVAIVNPLTAHAVQGSDPSGAGLAIRPLSVPIPFQVSVLVPSQGSNHPLLLPMIDALKDRAKELRDLGRRSSVINHERISKPALMSP
jgi:DNA-binding transcriptional LysR family regulator